MRWMEENKKKIEQFFRGREYSFEELMENIDNIEDFEIEVEEQIIKEQIIKEQIVKADKPASE